MEEKRPPGRPKGSKGTKNPRTAMQEKNIKEMVRISNRQISIARANLARKASVLMDRVYKNALGELPIEMTPSQLKSAELVLRKIVPDLSNITIHEDIKHEPMSRTQLLFKLNGLLNSNPELMKLIPKLVEEPAKVIQEAEAIEGELIPRSEKLN